MILETSQKIGIRKRFALREEGRGRSPKGARMGFLIIAALGMMIFLLSGCGSDSTPKGSAKGKKEPVAKSSSTMQAVAPLLSLKEGGTAPPLPQLDKIPILPPPEELEAKRAAAAKASADPKAIVLRGITNEELEAKRKAALVQKPDVTVEIVPGLTQKQLDAKLKAHRELCATPLESMPGLSEKQLKANAAQAWQEMKSTPHKQLFPPGERKKTVN
jgi:hypothetical protein